MKCVRRVHAYPQFFMTFRKFLPIDRPTVITATLLTLGAGFLLSLGCSQKLSGGLRHELVRVSSSDRVVNLGAIFIPPQDPARPVAVIWIPGEGMNYCSPTSVKMGQYLARRAIHCITANTRMHTMDHVTADDKSSQRDANREADGKEARDIAAWIDFAHRRGFKQIVLASQGAGGEMIRNYQATNRDPRVVGVVIASCAPAGRAENELEQVQLYLYGNLTGLRCVETMAFRGPEQTIACKEMQTADNITRWADQLTPDLPDENEVLATR